MFLVSGPELVIAACKAGIVGAFPTPNCRTAAELDEWMAAISSALRDASTQSSPHPIAPWALNLITHSSNPRLADDLALVKSHQPPIVITALGSPKPAIETVHGYGGLVFADVININLARKAAAAGRRRPCLHRGRRRRPYRLFLAVRVHLRGARILRRADRGRRRHR